MVVVVLDLIPIIYSGACDSLHSEVVTNWFNEVLPRADRILAISKSVARDVEVFFRSGVVQPRPDLEVGWFHLGADLDEIGGAPQPSVAALGKDAPFFLTVGTIEPRKGISVVIDAFETLWANGLNVGFVIAGKQGWNARALCKRIVTHPEFGRRLFWLQNASDQDLKHLYENAQALIFASFTEGFGLPLIEAARHGAPVIASDLPVFREIAGEHANYFDLLDAGSLACRIQDRLKGDYRQPTFPVLSWAQAAAIVLELARENPEFADRWTKLDPDRPAAPTDHDGAAKSRDVRLCV